MRVANHAATVAVVALCAVAASAATYYISPGGNDSRDGRSAVNAWRSISKVDGLSLVPGDSILLRGDTVHTSATALSLWTGNVARFSPDTPIVVSTYPSGSGPATLRITANDKNAVNIYNVAGIAVRKLIVEGPGPLQSSKTGISAYADLPGNVKLRSLTIDSCQVSGFKDGISIGAWASDNSFSGYQNVRITASIAHDNRMSGINSWGFYPDSPSGRSHRDIYVGHCVTHTNKGDPAYTANHSGNGIVLGNVSYATVEYCESYNNGELNASAQSNGPVGIWFWEVDHGVIQHCISHNNKSGNNADGGGFDLDGGCTNCVLQYNYSYDNVGAGILICQFSGASGFYDDTVRYNISQNDARSANCHGGITWYSAGSNGGLRRVHVYQNTVYNSVSSALRFCNTSGQSDNTVRNNVFITAGGRALVSGNVAPTVCRFQGNCYWPSGGAFNVAGYSTLAAWRTATGQEMRGSDTCGMVLDPMVTGPGAGAALTDPAQLATLQAYRLQTGSPCIDAGLDLQALFGISPGPHDFWGNPVPRGARLDIGAYEAETGTQTVPRAALRPGTRAAVVPPQAELDLSGRPVPSQPLTAVEVRARAGEPGVVVRHRAR